MKLNYVLLTAFLSLALGAVSCTNEMDAVNANISALSIKVKNQVASRAPITESTLPADDKGVGITLVNKSDKGKYDGQTGYDNTQWKTTDGTNWDIVGSTVPNLTGTEGVAVAYYPYSSTATDYMAIPVESASQTDYMYSGWSNDLTNASPEATFTMKHALAMIRVKLVLGNDYIGNKLASAVTISSDGFMATASLNAITGELSSKSGAGAEHTQDNLNLTLDTEGKEVDFLVIPAETVAPINFFVTIGNRYYVVSANTNEEIIKQGLAYTYTLTLSSVGMNVSNIQITPWNDKQITTDTMTKYNPWINLPNGVYAVSEDIEPVTADKADNTCVGVALIVNDAPVPQRIMIEKNPNRSVEEYATSTTTEYSSLLINYNTIDGITAGTLSFVNSDYKTWTEGACSDFNGIINSRVMEKYITGEKYMSRALADFNADQTQNLGYNDWYIPGCGQLLLIFKHISNIDNLLTKIGGTKITANHEIFWSSSVIYQTMGDVWNVEYNSKYNMFQVDTYLGSGIGGSKGNAIFIRNL